MESNNRAHFKAAIKQFCGGKKKSTSGTRPTMLIEGDFLVFLKP